MALAPLAPSPSLAVKIFCLLFETPQERGNLETVISLERRQKIRKVVVLVSWVVVHFATMASENDDNSRRDHSGRMETVIEAHRRSAGEADALIESLVSPSWGVSEGPHDNTADPLYASADRLLAQLPGGLAAVAPPPAPKRQGRDLRRVVFRRGVQLLSVGLARSAWCRLKAAVHQRACQIRSARAAIAVHRTYWARRQAAAFRLWDTLRGGMQPQIEVKIKKCDTCSR